MTGYAYAYHVIENTMKCPKCKKVWGWLYVQENKPSICWECNFGKKWEIKNFVMGTPYNENIWDNNTIIKYLK